MLTFLHAADFHLDSPFHALPPEQAAERRQEQRQLLTRLADTARQAQVDLVFLAGDLFDGQRARPETVQALYQVLEELEAEVFLSPGNHDPYSPTSPYGKFPWPDHVHIFTQAAPARVEVPQLGGGGLRQCLYLPLPDGQPPGRLPRPGGGPGRFRLLSWGPLLRPQPLRPHHPQ